MRGQSQHVQLGNQFVAFGYGRPDADARTRAGPLVSHQPHLRESTDVYHTQLFRLTRGNRHSTGGGSKRKLGTHDATSWLLSSAPFTGTSCRRARWRPCNRADPPTARVASLPPVPS